MHGWQNLWDYKLWVSWFQEIFLKKIRYFKSIEARDSMDGRIYVSDRKVRKRTKIRNRYNQAPHLTQDTNGKVTHHKREPLAQDVSPFPGINKHSRTKA